jgi:tRNA(Ile)-lysidine synthase
VTRDKTKSTPEQRVLRYIKEQHLVPPGQKLVVAVSGGPDSVCLIHILLKLRQELDIELHIAHLNHQLRGEESAADATYVAELARKFGIPATIASRNVNAYRAQHRISLEEAAREVRYTFLAEVAAKEGAGRVAVGHTAADHVETILMHLIRGSGTRGLRGLLPINTWPSAGTDLTIIRPLLELTREETAAYCRRHRLHPRIDASNRSPELFRNRIRHELLPLLQGYNPQVAEALQRTARIAADDLEFIDNEVARWQDKVARREGDAVILDRKKYLALPPALQRYLLRKSIESILGNLKDIEARHIENVLAALEKPSGKVIGLPEGLNFTIEYDNYVLAPDTASTCPFPALVNEHLLKVPGLTSIPGGDMVASVTTLAAIKDEVSKENAFTACFDFDETGSDLKVRHRLEGDRFQPLGMKNPKKLNTFMIDARIPRAWRGHIPLVTSPGQIIWVVGWRIDERAKVTAMTKKVLRLEFRRVLP